MVDHNLWLIELAERRNSRLALGPFEQLSQPERVFRCVWDLEAQVNNGGFEQYFFNSSGDHSHFALEALTCVGALQMRGIVQQAFDLVGAVALERDMSTRQGLLLDMTEDQQEGLEQMDQAYLAYPDDLTKLLFEYVQAHRTSFAGSRGPG